MAPELGPGPAAAGADGNSPGDADALTGRAWLATLPGELAAQRRVMAGLVDRCEAWPLVTSLLVGCSLGRGAADALSDIDAALGVDTPYSTAGAGRVGAVEAMVVAADLRPVRRRHPARPGGCRRGADRSAPPRRRRPGLHPAVPGSRPAGFP